MADEVEEIRETRVRRPDNTASSVTGDHRDDDAPSAVARIIYFVVGIILALLAFRVLLSLLGANRGNAFADFIYTTSYPFVAPFFGLFGYEVQYGIARFEIETLVAMLVYGLIGYGLANLLTPGQHHRHHYHYR